MKDRIKLTDHELMLKAFGEPGIDMIVEQRQNEISFAMAKLSEEAVLKNDPEFLPSIFVNKCLAFAETKAEELFILYGSGMLVKMIIQDLEEREEAKWRADVQQRVKNDLTGIPNKDDCECFKCQTRRREMRIEFGSEMNEEARYEWEKSWKKTHASN